MRTTPALLLVVTSTICGLAAAATPKKPAPPRVKPGKVDPRGAAPRPVVAPAPPPTPVATAPLTPPTAVEERLWKNKCGACHGRDGRGETGQGKKWNLRSLADPAWQASRTDAQLRARMSGGGAGASGASEAEMAAFDQLTPEQVDLLLHYTRWVGAPRQAP